MHTNEAPTGAQIPRDVKSGKESEIKLGVL